jgi:DDE superfamily endonuclease
LLLKILLQTLKELNFVPASDSEALSVLLEKTENIFLDGTERNIQRPLHKEEQKRHYSGKKNHTIKHNLICSESRKILYLSKAYNGTTHDKKLADDEGLIFPEGMVLKLYQDTGYQGYNPDNTTVIQPMKKPKWKELDQLQKTKNKEISSKRVTIEHAIGGVKILRIVKDEIRIYKEDTRNIVMQIAAAIHNLKICMVNVKSTA